MSPPAGQKIVELSPKKAELQKLFEGHPGALEVQPNAWILPRAFEKYAKDIHKLEVRCTFMAFAGYLPSTVPLL